jgi:hypothetical protein
MNTALNSPQGAPNGARGRSTFDLPGVEVIARYTVKVERSLSEAEVDRAVKRTQNEFMKKRYHAKGLTSQGRAKRRVRVGDEVPLKVFMQIEAARCQVTPLAIFNRIKRGGYPGLKRRKQKNLVFISFQEAPKFKDHRPEAARALNPARNGKGWFVVRPPRGNVTLHPSNRK